MCVFVFKKKEISRVYNYIIIIVEYNYTRFQCCSWIYFAFVHVVTGDVVWMQ